MRSTQASRSSILTTRRAPCTAVKGCQRKAAQVSYELPSGRRVRICAMHLQRMRRSGKLGEAGSDYGASQPENRRNKRCAAEIAKLRSAAGTEWRVTSGGAGSCLVVGITRKQAPVSCATTTLHAAARRNWLKIGPWREDGSRCVEVTKDGVEAIEGP